MCRRLPAADQFVGSLAGRSQVLYAGVPPLSAASAGARSVLVMRASCQNPARSAAKPSRRALAWLFALACVAALAAPAQTQPPAHRGLRHRPRLVKTAADQPANTAAPPAQAPLPSPSWPVNDPPAPPSVILDSQGLHIIADNASLSSILDQIATETGAKIEGLSEDERVFGDYGPGSPREVLAQLFNGANYNVLILGDLAQTEPIHVLLSPRRAGASSQPSGQPRQPEQEEDSPEPQEEQPQPYQPPVVNRPPNQPNRPLNQPSTQPDRPLTPLEQLTPQERMQQMQELQRQFQQQQPQQPQ